MTTRSAPDEDDFAVFLGIRNLFNKVQPKDWVGSRIRGALLVLSGRAHPHTDDDRETYGSILDSGLRLASFYRAAFYEARERVFELSPSETWLPQLSLKSTSELDHREITKPVRGFPVKATANDVLSLVAEVAGIDLTAGNPIKSGAIILWNEEHTKLAKVETTLVPGGILICKVTVLSVVDDGVEIKITSDTFKASLADQWSLEKGGLSSSTSDFKLDVVKTDEWNSRKIYSEIWEAAKEFRSDAVAKYDPNSARILLDNPNYSPFI